MQVSDASIWIGIASPVIVAAVTWGGMRAELRHLTERVRQLEELLGAMVKKFIDGKD